MKILITCLLLVYSELAFSAVLYEPYGVNFSPFIKDQDPTPGTLIVKQSQVASRIAALRSRSLWIRTFSTTHGMENAGAYAHKYGFKSAIGAWLSSPSNFDVATSQNANDEELNSLISAAKRGKVDVAVVGNEVLLRNDLTSAQLVAYVRRVRAAIPANIPVSVVDTYGTLIAHPEIIAECDLVMANFYPYWEGTRIDGAMSSITNNFNALKKAAGSKQVWISETGWPSEGNSVGDSVPNRLNSAYFFTAFNSWARDNNIPSFYFEAFDEKWKGKSAEGPQGAHWGIRNASGGMKSYFNLVYQGYTLPPEVYLRIAPTNNSTKPTGSASVELTSVPAYGSSSGITGLVKGVATSQYQIAVYINVAGGWWTKPTFASPTVGIKGNGTFTCNTVTGGSDQNATEFYVFVIPVGYAPPASGGGSIPSEIFSHAVAYTDFSRPPGFTGYSSKGSVEDQSIKSIAIRRNFSGTPKAVDTVTISAIIPLESKPYVGTAVTLNVGGLEWRFAPLDQHLRSVATGGTLTNSTGKLSFGYSSTYIRITTSVSCPSKSDVWSQYGMLNRDLKAPGVPVFLPITVTIGNVGYEWEISSYYSSKKDKSGAMTGSSKNSIY